MEQDLSDYFKKRCCVRHKYHNPNSTRCLDCSWEEEESQLRLRIPQPPGVRYGVRFDFTIEEAKNLHYGKCWCGKPKSQWEKFKRKYCCSEHADIWYSKTIRWAQFKDRIRAKHRDPIRGQYCDNCGRASNEANGARLDFDVDHILAIVNGGDEWDENNLQVLCTDCHKEKTKEDMRIYRENLKCATMTS